MGRCKKKLKEKHPDIDRPGSILMVYRSLAKLSQKKLSELSGISQGRISEIESGKRGIGVRQAKKLAKFLEISYRKFL